MKPLRFLILFFASFILGAITAFFMLFSAQYLGRPSLIFIGLLLTFVYTFVFSWWYFRGVQEASWRARVEAIVVWMGLYLIFDYMVLTFFYGGSISDLGAISVFSYGTILLILFVSAYITTSQHPKLSADAPNLM